MLRRDISQGLVGRIARGGLVVEVELGAVQVGDVVEVEVGAERGQQLVQVARVGQVAERLPQVPVGLVPLGGGRARGGALAGDVLLLVALELLE